MNLRIDPPRRDRWARFRFSLIGPLLAAPPPPGELHGALCALAARTWRHPASGLDVTFGVSTLERWYYAMRTADDPVAALRNKVRGDIGRFPSISAPVAVALTQQYREHPGWTVQLHVDNLQAVIAGEAMPSYASVRRYFKARGMFRQARPKRSTPGALLARDRLEQLEVRCYEADYVSALWHLDFHKSSRDVLNRAGEWIRPSLLGIMDDRSRLVCHLQWYAQETAECLVHGLSQAFMKRGLPRALMTDNGAAMIAAETEAGLHRLAIEPKYTLPYSPHFNGKQETFWARVEGRLMAMLEGEAALTLDQLNHATQAWVEQDYHRSLHGEFNATPLERYLAGPTVARPCPGADVISLAFRIEQTRRQRRLDGTVMLEGIRFEVPSIYRHLEIVHLRYARWNLARVDMVEPRTGTILSSLTPLNRSANNDGRRRALARPAIDLSPLPPQGMAPLLKQMMADYAATGLPPAYLPMPEDDV